MYSISIDANLDDLKKMPEILCGIDHIPPYEFDNHYYK